MSNLRTIAALLRRDWLATWRNPGEMLNGMVFFVLVVVMFPFATSADGKVLVELAAGIIWVAALLANSLSLSGLFRSDYLDGSLETIALSGSSLATVALAKSFMHWLSAGLPVVVLSIPMALLLSIDSASLATVLISLSLGSAAMSLLGTPISALTVGLRGGGLLLAMLILPLYIPLLIFGAQAASNARLGLSASAELYFLAGFLVLALTLSPWATAAAIRIRLS